MHTFNIVAKDDPVTNRQNKQKAKLITHKVCNKVKVHCAKGTYFRAALALCLWSEFASIDFVDGGFTCALNKPVKILPFEHCVHKRVLRNIFSLVVMKDCP